MMGFLYFQYFINPFQLARNSLFCLPESSATRQFILQILSSRVFHGLLLLFLILNLVAFGLYNFEYRLSAEGVSSDLAENVAAFYLELFCNLFFSLELVLRIIAAGAVLEPYAYLRTGEGVTNFLLFILK